MKAIRTRRVAALGATCALAAAGMFGAMAANADEESMSGGQSGSEQSGGNGGEEGQSGGNGGEEGQSGGEEGQSGGEEGQSGGEEGGDEGVIVDGLMVRSFSGNVLNTSTQFSVTWEYADEEDAEEGEDEGVEDISLRADSDFVLDAVTVDGKPVDFTCGDVTESEYGYAYASCDLDFGPAMAGAHDLVVTSGDFTASDRFYRDVTVTSDVKDGKLTQKECSPVDVTYTVSPDQLKYLPAGAEVYVKASYAEHGVVGRAAEETGAIIDGKAVVALDLDAREGAYKVSAGLKGIPYYSAEFDLTVEAGSCAGTDGGTTGGLAQTGANAGWVALAALATIGVGAGAVAINRRRA